MFKKLFLILSLLFICSSVFYAQKITVYKYYHYKGTIDGKYPVTMDLIINGKTVKGSYYYNKVGKILSLNGTIDKNNIVKMDEYSYFHPYSGNFQGKINRKIFKGTWNDVTGEKKMPFSLMKNYNHSAQLEFYHFTAETKLFSDNKDVIYTQAGTYLFPISCPNRVAQNLILPIIEKIYFNTACTNIQNCIRKYVKKGQKDYLSMKEDITKKDLSDMSFAYTWEDSDSIQIIMNDDDILSFSINYYSYTGGAHGMYGTSYENFDIYSGKQLTMWDIFNKSNKSQILDKIKQKIITEKLQNDVFSMKEVTLTENIAIYKKGIKFLYNPYEIGPFSSGAIELFFTYNEIKDLLTQNFKRKIGL